MSSFTTMDSASEYSFVIPHSTFIKAYERYVSLVEAAVKSGKTPGLFDLIDLKQGRKVIEKEAKSVVVDVAKGLKKVGFLLFNSIAWNESTRLVVGKKNERE